MNRIFDMTVDDLRRARLRAFILGANATARRLDQELAARASPERRFRLWAA